MGVGSVGSRRERHNAQRHRMFHWEIPVLVLSRISWSLACDERRICLILILHVSFCRSLFLLARSTLLRPSSSSLCFCWPEVPFFARRLLRFVIVREVVRTGDVRFEVSIEVLIYLGVSRQNDDLMACPGKVPFDKMAPVLRIKAGHRRVDNGWKRPWRCLRQTPKSRRVRACTHAVDCPVGGCVQARTLLLFDRYRVRGCMSSTVGDAHQQLADA